MAMPVFWCSCACARASRTRIGSSVGIATGVDMWARRARRALRMAGYVPRAFSRIASAEVRVRASMAELARARSVWYEVGKSTGAAAVPPLERAEGAGLWGLCRPSMRTHGGSPSSVGATSSLSARAAYVAPSQASPSVGGRANFPEGSRRRARAPRAEGVACPSSERARDAPWAAAWACPISWSTPAVGGACSSPRPADRFTPRGTGRACAAAKVAERSATRGEGESGSTPQPPERSDP